MARKNEFTVKADKTIGLRIQELRLARGLSREQLAKKIGVTHQQLQKYEKAINRISVGRLVLIANALDKNVEFFFEDIDGFIPTNSKRQRLSMELSREFLQIKDVGVQDSLVMLTRNLNRVLS